MNYKIILLIAVSCFACNNKKETNQNRPNDINAVAIDQSLVNYKNEIKQTFASVEHIYDLAIIDYQKGLRQEELDKKYKEQLDSLFNRTNNELKDVADYFNKINGEQADYKKFIDSLGNKGVMKKAEDLKKLGIIL